MYDVFYLGTKENTKRFLDLKARIPTIKFVTSAKQAKKKAFTKYYWLITEDLLVCDNFKFDYTPDEWSTDYIHVFKNSDSFKGIALIPRKITVPEENARTRNHTGIKKVDIVASVDAPYDYFNVDSYEDYQYALQHASDEMFWVGSNNIKVDNELVQNFRISVYDEDLKKQNHAFIHRVDGKDYYNGLFLCSESKPLSKKEIEHRFPVDRIEQSVIGSTAVDYDIFSVDSYEEYKYALENSTTEMFWITSKNLKPNLPKIYFTFDNQYDREQNHAFIHRVDDKDYYNGVFLCSKKTPLSKREIEYRFPVNRKEWDIVASGPIEYDVFDINSYEDYEYALENSTTEMFWGKLTPMTITDESVFEMYFNFDNEYDRKQNHAFLHDVNGIQKYDGLYLFSTHTPISKREIEYRHVVVRKEWDKVVSTHKPYDVFDINSYEDYEYALENSTTEMFWGKLTPMTITDESVFEIYFDDRTNETKFDRDHNHAFLHEVEGVTKYDGLYLFSTHTPVSKREIEYRHVVVRKEWDKVVSTYKPYNVFDINSYNDYVQALETSTTEMFWGKLTPMTITDESVFEIYFNNRTDETKFDREHNHAFLHEVEGVTKYDGLYLFSKYSPVSKREIEYRHVVVRKEWDKVVSTHKLYDQYFIETFEEYQNALENSTTEMFWMLSKNLKISDNFDLSLYFDDRTNETKYDREQTHAFIHKVGDNNYYNGVFLCSKKVPLSKREIEYRFPVNRKEHKIIASGPIEYDQFAINNFNDYQNALENTTTEMFWAIPSNVTIDPNFKFDTYFSFDQEYERKINHVFLNGKYKDGVVLCSKHSLMSKREWEYRFVTHKKEHNINASYPKPFDIVFISYNEPNAEENYQRLLKRYPNAKRVHKVKGIHQAHIEAAKLCSTNMFWVVDGDAIIADNFNLDHQVAQWDQDTVHVWRSQNPINNLVYGYGGIKLLPTKLTINMNTSKPDMTTSITNKFKPMLEVSNITAFDTDEFNTWKSAFRECVKLASKTIQGQVDEETEQRLETWCTVGEDKPYGSYALAGARAGREFGLSNSNDIKLINDFDWLYEQFSKHTVE